MSHVTLAQGVLRARHPCVIRMLLLSSYSSTLRSALFTVSIIFLFILFIFTFIFIFHVGWFDTIASKTIPYFANLNSALIELEKSASGWTRTRRKIFTYRMTEDEYFRYKQNWWISFNKAGKIGPMRDRSDFNEALTKLHRLHQESGENNSHRFLSGNTRNGIRRLLHPAHPGGGTIPGGAHDNQQESPQLSSCKKRSR